MKKLLRKNELHRAIKARTRLVRFPVTFRAAFQVTKKKEEEFERGGYFKYVRLSGLGEKERKRREGKRERKRIDRGNLSTFGKDLRLVLESK